MNRIVVIAPYCLTVCAQACTIHSVYIGVVCIWLWLTLFTCVTDWHLNSSVCNECIGIELICIWLQPTLFIPVLQGPPICKDSNIEGSQDDSEEGSEEEGCNDTYALWMSRPVSTTKTSLFTRGVRRRKVRRRGVRRRGSQQMGKMMTRAWVKKY